MRASCTDQDWVELHREGMDRFCWVLRPEMVGLWRAQEGLGDQVGCLVPDRVVVAWQQGGGQARWFRPQGDRFLLPSDVIPDRLVEEILFSRSIDQLSRYSQHGQWNFIQNSGMVLGLPYMHKGVPVSPGRDLELRNLYGQMNIHKSVVLVNRQTRTRRGFMGAICVQAPWPGYWLVKSLIQDETSGYTVSPNQRWSCWTGEALFQIILRYLEAKPVVRPTRKLGPETAGAWTAAYRDHLSGMPFHLFARTTWERVRDLVREGLVQDPLVARDSYYGFNFPGVSEGG